MTHSQGLSSNFNRAESIGFLTLKPIIVRSVLILSSHLELGYPRGLFPISIPVKILKTHLLSSLLATCPAQLKLLDLITVTILGEKSKLCNYLQSLILSHLNLF
jgi:hypothetical protein